MRHGGVEVRNIRLIVAFPADSSAQWIWSANADGDDVVYVRKVFYLTDPLNPDSDDDGLLDGVDAAPLDPSLSESLDTDGDGIADAYDTFPEDASEATDNDSDGIGDNTDNCFRVANAAQADADQNGIGDLCELNTVVNALTDEALKLCVNDLSSSSCG